MHRQLRLLLLISTFLVFAWGMFGPIYAIFVKKIGGDILDTGFSWGIYMIVSGVGIFFMGKFQDKLKREKPVLLIGYGLRCIVLLAYMFITSIIQLFILQFLLGLSIVITVPAFDSLYTKNLKKGKFASQWAYFESIYFGAQGVAALAGAALVKFFSFGALFFVMFLLTLFGLILVTSIKEKNEH